MAGRENEHVLLVRRGPGGVPEYYLDVLYLQQFLFLDGRNQTSTASIAVNGHNKYAIPTTIPDMAELSHQQEKIKFVAADEDCHADRPVFSLDATASS